MQFDAAATFAKDSIGEIYDSKQISFNEQK